MVTYKPRMPKAGLEIYVGDLSRGVSVKTGDEAFEDTLPADLALLGGIFPLALERRPELSGGHEERAGLADRLR